MIMMRFADGLATKHAPTLPASGPRGALAAAVALGAALSVSSCGDSTPPEPPASVPTTVTVSPAAATLEAIEATVRLTATVQDQFGWAMQGAQVTWSTSDDAVATVDTGGLVTAVGNGAVAVAATSGSASGTAAVTVEQVVAQVTVTPDSVAFGALGDTVRVAGAAVDGNGHGVSGVEISWSTSDDAVATVDTGGLVTAVGNGAVAVAATSGSASGTAAVTVEQVVAQVTVTPDSVAFGALGDTVRVAGAAVDGNGHGVSGVEISWSTSDDAVATVDTRGLVTAVGNGAVAVAATSGSASGTAAVTVEQVVAQVTVTPDSVAFGALGDTVRVAGAAVDGNGHGVPGVEISWSTSDDAVATVDTGGLVTAVGNGAVAVAATSGSASGTAAVTVEQVVAQVTVTPDSVAFGALGDTVRVAGAAVDGNGHGVSGVEISWSTSDDAVATVDTGGLVTAVGNGAVAVAATSGSASGTAAVTVEQVVAQVTVTPDSVAFGALGDTVRVAGAAVDGNGHGVSGVEISWSTSDDAVATVDTGGLVTAVGNGAVAVAATSGSASGTAAVTVEQVVAQVTVTPGRAVLFALGTDVLLEAAAIDASGHHVVDAGFSWASTAAEVAAVDASGLVKAVGKGVATIIATSDAAQGAAEIEVVNVDGDVDRFLRQNDHVADAMVWFGRPYALWPNRLREKLTLAVDRLLQTGDSGLPDLMTNQDPPESDFSLLFLMEDAEDLYVANLALSLVLEMSDAVPWSLHDLSYDELRLLLASDGFFFGTRVYDNLVYVHPYAVPAPPEVVWDFIVSEDLVGGSRYETLVRVLHWTRYHLLHFGYPAGVPTNYDPVRDHWDYPGGVPLMRVLAGSTRKHDGFEGHFTAGCHGTNWVLKHLLRLVNIPVEYLLWGGHAVPSFPSERLYLSHGDDPYSGLGHYTQPFSEPFPTDSLLISEETYQEWFSTFNSPEENRNNVSRRTTELGVRHLSQYLLHYRCVDLALGLSNEDSNVYRPGNAGVGRYWTVAELEAMSFWERMDAKISQHGGCPVRYPWPPHGSPY